mgnify:CR=1 FL=1
MIKFILNRETRYKKKIRFIRTDNGTEFVNNMLETFCENNGIQHQKTNSYSPQQNGIVERNNRTIFETVRTLLNSANVPHEYWAETMVTAIYLINVWIKGDGISSYEKFFGRKPSYNHLKTFGCVAYYHQPKHLRNKLEETSVKMMFIGYTNSTVNYRLLDPENLTVITTNDVRFDESELYFTESSDNRFIVQTADSSTDIESDDIEERVHDIQTSNLFGYSCINSSIIPTSYENALKMSDVEQWKEAIQKEVDQLQKYGVFERIPVDESRKIIKTKWIFTKKRSGIYKARLVACGYSQEFGYDYFQTASPTPDRSLTNIVLSYAKTFNHKVRQLDVRTAFLNAELDEPVYVETPPGFGSKGHLQLKKALYGLKQSPLQWYKTISSYLMAIGFKRSVTDRCLFKLDESLLLLYVDDMIITGPDESKLTQIVEKLEKRFEITDLGQVHDYLGLRITETETSFDLCQSVYIRKLLKEFNMEDCKVTNVPMSNLYQHNNEEEINESLPIQKLLGSLIYIANRTRPDICFAVNWLSRFIKKPTNSLWLAAKQILRFLAGTVDQKLVLGCLDSQIELFTDASFGQGETRHSTSGLLIRSGKSLLFWRSIKQNKISTSSCESESRAILDGYNSVVFIKEVMDFIGFRTTVKVKCDNKSANYIFSGSTMKKSKHFDLEIKKIIEVFSEDPDYGIEYVETSLQLADILTKPLMKISFERIAKKIFG